MYVFLCVCVCVFACVCSCTCGLQHSSEHGQCMQLVSNVHACMLASVCLCECMHVCAYVCRCVPMCGCACRHAGACVHVCVRDMASMKRCTCRWVAGKGGQCSAHPHDLPTCKWCGTYAAGGPVPGSCTDHDSYGAPKKPALAQSEHTHIVDGIAVIICPP